MKGTMFPLEYIYCVQQCILGGSVYTLTKGKVCDSEHSTGPVAQLHTGVIRSYLNVCNENSFLCQ